MLKLIFSSTNKRKRYVVFMDCPRALAGITCKSFATVDEAINFAYQHSDPWIGNIDNVFMDRLIELKHPLLKYKRSF